MQEILNKLSAPFPSPKWKVQSKKGKFVTCVAYIDARLVAERLDEATQGMWRDEYTEVSGLLMCTISIWNGEQWISRSDTGVEPPDNGQGVGVLHKGHTSDAFKRAAVKFGVGRSLYELPLIKFQQDSGNIYYNGKALKDYEVPAVCAEIFANYKGTGDIMVWANSNKPTQQPAPQQPAPQAQLTNNTPKPTEAELDEYLKICKEAGIDAGQKDLVWGAVLAGKRTYKQAMAWAGAELEKAEAK